MRFRFPAAVLLLTAALWLSGAFDAPVRASVFAARVTVYLPTGNVMRSGIYPYPGAAACDWNYLPMGTRFTVGGREYRCLDTGGLVRGWHVDLFVPTWDEGVWLQSQIGEYSTITVLAWGTNPPWWQGV